MTDLDFKTIAEHAAKEGWIRPAATVTPAKRKYVRREPVARTSRANLGIVMREGRKYVIEYSPKAGIVVRQFYRQTKHTISLGELVDIAIGQIHLLKFDDRATVKSEAAKVENGGAQ